MWNTSLRNISWDRATMPYALQLLTFKIRHIRRVLFLNYTFHLITELHLRLLKVLTGALITLPLKSELD